VCSEFIRKHIEFPAETTAALASKRQGASQLLNRCTKSMIDKNEHIKFTGAFEVGQHTDFLGSFQKESFRKVSVTLFEINAFGCEVNRLR